MGVCGWGVLYEALSVTYYVYEKCYIDKVTDWLIIYQVLSLKLKVILLPDLFMFVISVSVCVSVVGVCEACAGPAGWHIRADGLQCPLSLCVYVSGHALPLHALHHWGAVAETPTIQTQSCCPHQPVFTAIPLLLSTGRTTTFNRCFISWKYWKKT